jgi:CHAT domain-containing protein/tetratricopeptide (TPR) repeat protein
VSDEPEAVRLLNLASGAFLLGNTRSALELIDEAITAAGAGDPVLQSVLLVQKAGWLRESGRAEDAAAAVEQGARQLGQVPEEGNETEWSGLRTEQGNIARVRGDFATAEALYVQAEALAEKSPARDLLVTTVYANRAAVHMDQGRLGDAQDALLTALEIDQRIGSKDSESNDLNMLGLVAKRRGDADTAKAYFLKAFDVAYKTGLTRRAMEAIANFSAYLDDAGDHEKAAQLFRETGSLLASAGDEAGFADAIANQAVATANAGDPGGAIVLLTRARELHLATGNRLTAVGDLINLSQAEERLDRHDQALAHAEEALREAGDLGLIDMLWRAEYLVASCRAILAAERVPDGQEPDSETFSEVLAGYRRAIDYIELLRSNVDRPDERQAMLVGKEQVYRAAIALSLAFGLGRDALAFSERARMRSFLDALGSSRVERLEMNDPAAARRAELVALLLSLRTPPGDKPGLLDELRTLRAEMVARQPAVAAVTEAELPSVADILAAIPEGTAMLVFYQLADTQVIIFPLFPDAGLPHVTQVDFDEPVEDVVMRFRREIERGDPELPTGNKLFATFFRPVMPLLASTQNVIVVPHGVLHYLPFSALWFVPAGDDAPPREYLRTRFIEATVPSASYLPVMARLSGLSAASGGDQVPGGSRAYGLPVVLGNPTGDLPGAEEEARLVAGILGVTPRLGAAATRDALLAAGSPSVLHVASHGIYDSADPLLSRVEMADGGITVEDLLTTGPAPGVLVLSGCVTGLSDRKPGDELTGLAQAMLRRGTRAVIATLWETFDESSAVFFRHFFTALMNGSPVNEAMTIARHYLATGPGGYDQPVDWAPFVLIGDPGHRVVDLADPSHTDYDRGLELARQEDLEGALREFSKSMNSSDPRVASESAYQVGIVRYLSGDMKGALAAYQAAADSGNPEVAGLANYRIAQILDDEDHDTDGALAAYRRAMDSGVPDAAAMSAVDVGVILASRGDAAGARAAYQRAIDSGHPEASPKAANNLGALLDQAGDVDGARVAYQRAIDAGDPEVSPTAANSLGGLLGEAGDVDGARVAYQRAIDAGHPEASPRAAYNLGTLLREAGDVDGARVAYRYAMDSGTRIAPAAAVALGVMLATRGEVDAACVALQQAIDTGDPNARPVAAYNLGLLLMEHQDLAGARAALTIAGESNDHDITRSARSLLAQLGRLERTARRTERRHRH